MTTLVFNSNNFVNAQVLAGHKQMSLVPTPCDATLAFYLEVIFIKIIGCIDLSIRKSCSIQLLTNSFLEIAISPESMRHQGTICHQVHAQPESLLNTDAEEHRMYLLERHSFCVEA